MAFLTMVLEARMKVEMEQSSNVAFQESRLRFVVVEEMKVASHGLMVLS
jgi:hypothetical protein